MQGQFSDDALEQALFEFIEEGWIESFEEYFDFGATCMRADGTLYGISGGKCRKGNETGAAPKRGRPAGGKNVTKAQPGEAAARMKAAYDRLVGMDLSKKPTMVTQEPSIRPSNIRAKLDSVNAKADKAAREMAKYEGPSGHVQPKDKAAWDKAHESYGRHMSDMRKLIDAKHALQKRQDEVAAQMNRVGAAHLREKDPEKRAQLESEYKKYESVYAKLQKAQTPEGTQTWMAKLGISEAPPSSAAMKAMSAAQGKVTRAAELDKAILKKLEEQGGAYVGSKLASMIEERNRLKKEIKEGVTEPKKAVTPIAKSAEELRGRQDEALKAQQKALASYNKAVAAEDAAYKKLMKARDDEGKSFTARQPERDEHKRLEKIAAEKFEVLKKADVALNELKNRGQELVDRPSDRLSLKQLRAEARDYEALRKRMMFAGEKPSEIQKAAVHVSAAKSIIRHQKEVQDDRIVASMNRSVAGKELHNLNRVAERKAGIENIKMGKLMELKRNASDPEKVKKLDEQIREANHRRLLMLREIEKNNANFAARKNAAEEQAKALAEAAPKNATKVRDMAKNISVMNHFLSAKGASVERIQQGIASLERNQQAIDQRMGANQERANKYASMIRNAKSPSEKKLLEEAFAKRRPELQREMMSAMKALDKNQQDLAKLQKEEVKARDALDKGLAERNKYQRDLDRIKNEGTLASEKTKFARRTADDVMDLLQRAPKSGRFVETLGGTKPDFDMNVGPGSGSKRLSAGAYGTAFKVPGPPPATVKYGNIGRDEVTAMQRVAALGLAPNVLKGERVHGAGEEPGRFAYEFAKGKPMMDLANAGQVTRTMKDEFWAARAQMHKAGVAHNDLHPGNVIVDNGKVKFIDFGLARLGNKAALGEALGLDRAPGAEFNRWSNAGDKQIKRWGQAFGADGGRNPSNLQRILDNRKEVEKAMRQDGLDDKTVSFLMKGGDYFRQPDSHFDRGDWQKISDGAAQRYMDILYNGVS